MTAIKLMMNIQVRFPLAIRLLFLAGCLPLVSNASILLWDRTEARIQMSPEQDQAEVDYQVTNQGEDTLRIDRIETTCGCTNPIIEKRILKPGASTKITAIFNKGKRRGKTHSKLTVFMEGNSQPVATLHMIIDIPELVKTQPSVVYWNKQTERSPRTIRIRLDPKYVETISAIDYNESTLRLTQRKVDDSQTEFELEMEPINYENTLRETVEIKATGTNGYTGIGKLHVLVQP